jgi:hypothetical protein
MVLTDTPSERSRNARTPAPCPGEIQQSNAGARGGGTISQIRQFTMINPEVVLLLAAFQHVGRSDVCSRVAARQAMAIAYWKARSGLQK